jgi:hypothetical protein
MLTEIVRQAVEKDLIRYIIEVKNAELKQAHGLDKQSS